jgi:hypothetical protein
MQQYEEHWTKFSDQAEYVDGGSFCLFQKITPGWFNG